MFLWWHGDFYAKSICSNDACPNEICSYKGTMTFTQSPYVLMTVVLMPFVIIKGIVTYTQIPFVQMTFAIMAFVL
jgi:hypothetical protein